MLAARPLSARRSGPSDPTSRHFTHNQIHNLSTSNNFSYTISSVRGNILESARVFGELHEQAARPPTARSVGPVPKESRGRATFLRRGVKAVLTGQIPQWTVSVAASKTSRSSQTCAATVWTCSFTSRGGHHDAGRQAVSVMASACPDASEFRLLLRRGRVHRWHAGGDSVSYGPASPSRVLRQPASNWWPWRLSECFRQSGRGR